ncbi:hypothetical protein [Actinoplanes sp. URMC 104]|uniref:hypothetical protein n=1 Tax=Actinoplanes sp. URMC 104 TaxID=3423409 RepID=UPI003F1CC478
MSMTLEAAVPPSLPVDPPRPPDRGDLRRASLALLPWVLPLAALVLAWSSTDVGWSAMARYLAYFLVGVAVPGTLTYRALRGSRGNLPEDLGLGSAAGLVIVLTGWALAAATGLQALLPVWPLLVIAVFVAVPRLRRHWRITDPRPLPVRWSWMVAATLVVVVLMNYPGWTRVPLPPATAYYYQDVLYHLSLVHEMTRTMPFEVPQLAGDPLRYHFLANADMATASMVTGIAPATILLRLWIVPITVVSVLVTATLGRELSGKWWAGALAGAAAIVGLPLALSAPGIPGSGPIGPNSPSQTYAFPLLALLLILAVDLLRGRRLGYGWVLVLPVALACAGAKSSTLPPVVAGLVLAGLVVLVTDRARLRPLLVFLSLVLAAMLAGIKIFAGGGAGILAVQPLSLMWFFAPYRTTLGAEEVIDGTRLLPSGIENATATGLVFLTALFVWWLLAQAPRLLGVLSVGAARTRRDPVAWLFAGVTAAGVGAAWLFWHPSASQGYFFATVIPFAAVLSVWYLAEHTTSVRPVIAGFVAGAAWFLVVPDPAVPGQPSFSSWSWTLWLPMLASAVAAVVAATIGLLVWRARTGRLAWRALPVALAAAVLGAGITLNVDQQTRSTVEALTEPPPPVETPQRIVTRDETAAALWIDRHAGDDDIVATNVHCNPITYKASCDSRAFWVTALGGRRTVVESWGYTDQAVAQDGVNGLRYALQPAPYPERFALNERVFTKANPSDLAELKRRYGVRWLLADRRVPKGVSARLARIAPVRYTAGPVTVHEVP